ncbi:MAG: hypothetical protein RBQ91_05745 [Acholeplasma sp.]|nr:hypothetical protein [Acholeplasma sp.]
MKVEQLDKISSLNGFSKNHQNHYKLLACIQSLKQSEQINEAFIRQIELEEISETLINIYGLLQNLFVSIDALYDMSRITMDHKYAVNLNMNKNLHELKYIRNDIVGHPTHRTYQSGGVGFSTMTIDQTTMRNLVYETHFFKKKNHEIRYRKISTLDLIKDYSIESNQIIEEIYNYLTHETKTNELSDMALQFYEILVLDTFDYSLLQKIKTFYQNTQKIPKDSHNRIMWRISLLEMLDNWKEKDQDKKEYIRYMKLQQAAKLYEMTSIIENRAPKLLELSLPELLKSFYRFLKEDEGRLKAISTLHDFDHPYFSSDLDHLMLECKQHSKARKLLNWLKNQSNEYRVYTIGSSLQKYKSAQF